MARNTNFHTRHPRSGNQGSSFHGQSGGQSGGASRQFDKRGAQPEQPARGDVKAVFRRQTFKKLIADVADGISKVAAVCELTEERVKRLYEGQDLIDAPMAMHLEESLYLPAGWMESDQPIPKETLERLDRSLSGIDHDEFTIDVDGAGGQRPSVADSEILDALSQSANTEQQASESKEDGMQQNIFQLKEIFPAVHVYLHQKTDLSPASISGILSGSRNLTEANARLFEAALNLPEGWLHQSMPIDQAEAELVSAVGDLINMPVPRRGRRPGPETAETTPAEKARPVRAAKPAPSAATPAKMPGKVGRPAKAARVLAPMPAPAASAPVVSVPAAPVIAAPASPVMRPYVENASPRPAVANRADKTVLDVVPGGLSLSRALINALEQLEAKGELDAIKVTRVLNALYMN